MPELTLATALKIKDDFTATVVKGFRRLEDVGKTVADNIGARLKDRLREAAEEARKEREAERLAERKRREEEREARRRKRLEEKREKEESRAREKIISAGRGGAASISERIDSLGGFAARAGAGVAAGAAAGLIGVAHVLNGVAGDMARIIRTAKAQGLDPTLLAAIEARAAEEGIDNLDEVGRATEEFFLRLSELQQKNPTGELFSKLKDVGATDLIKQFKAVKDPTEALTLALSTLATEKDKDKRISLADGIFGGSDAGLDLRRIAKTKDEVRDLFLRQKELSGATKEQFAAAEELAKAKAKLSAQYTSVKRALAGALAPAMEDVVSKLGAWAKANRDVIDSKIGEFVAWATAKIRELMALPWEDYLQRAADAAREAGSAARELGGFLVAVAGEAVTWGRRVIAVGQDLGITTDTLVTAAKAFFVVWSANKVAQIGNNVIDLAQKFKDVGSAIKTAAEGGSRAASVLDKAMKLTGMIGGIMAGVGALKLLLDHLDKAETLAKRNVDYDIAGQGQKNLDRAQELTDSNYSLEKFAAAPAWSAAGMAGVPEVAKFLERSGGNVAVAQRMAANEVERNRKTIDQLVQEAKAIEQVARIEQEDPTSVEAAKRQAAASAIVPFGPQLPEAQKLLDTMSDLQKAALRQAKATEEQIALIRDQRYRPATGAR